jgi:DNA-binding transcriptional LysR family regulator
MIRSKRGVTLTPAGKLLLAQARGLLGQWEKICQSAGNSTVEISGHYRLGCHPAVATMTLHKFLPAIYEEFSQLNLTLVHDLSRNITEQVISHEIDLAIVVNPVEHPDLIIQPIFKDEVCLWTTGRRKSSLDPTSGAATIICDPALIQCQLVLKKLAKSGIRYGRIVHSSSLEVVRSLTAGELGLGILPTCVAYLDSHRPLKKVVHSPTHIDSIAVVYRVENRSVATIKFLARRIKDAFS